MRNAAPSWIILTVDNVKQECMTAPMVIIPAKGNIFAELGSSLVIVQPAGCGLEGLSAKVWGP